MPRTLPTLLLMLSVMLSQVAGCATMKLPLFKADKQMKADAQHPVSQIICVWQPAEGRGLDELPGRGFAGQVVFLTADSPTPVEVEGDVTIFLFDDQGTLEQRSKPLHVFRFVEGSWQTYLTPTAWGPTYQLYIPYVRKGVHRASCSLVVQIETPDARRATSAMANIVLPGNGSVSDGTASRYAPQHSRIPAGRVEIMERGDGSRVLPASAQSPLPTVPDGPRAAGDATPKFESFSIPYDFHRANAQ